MLGSLSGCAESSSATPAGSAKTPAPTAGVVTASDAPEVSDLKFGIIALTDCSPIVIAHEKGLFKKYGINSTVMKGASWAAIRDSLTNGDLHATHMLIGMPIASTMGLLGSPKKPMVVPWLLNRNGQAITLKASFKGKVTNDPKALKPFVDEAKAKGTPLTFAMTFPPGTHAMWMRYYLAAGGIHPDKVCAFTAEFAEKNPKTVKAVLKALHEASIWLDNMDNRPEQAEIVSAASYINCPKEIILGRLQGHYDMRDGRSMQDKNYMIFHDRNCNYPQLKYATWWLAQFRRWGMVEGTPDYDGIAQQVMRPDLYEEAMKEIGFAHGGANSDPEKFFDGGIFDPADPEKYATSFAINSLK